MRDDTQQISHRKRHLECDNAQVTHRLTLFGGEWPHLDQDEAVLAVEIGVAAHDLKELAFRWRRVVALTHQGNDRMQCRTQRHQRVVTRFHHRDDVAREFKPRR